MQGLEVRKRARKRGKVEPVRYYNHHISMRLTYFEAQTLRLMLAAPGGSRSPREKAAEGRIWLKVQLAATADQEAVQRANMVKRIATLRAKVKAVEDSGAKPDWEDVGTIDYLEGRLACEDFLQSGAIKERK